MSLETSKTAPRGGIQVIARAAKILRVLENEQNGLSLSEIANKVELARSTVQRIVTALADEQLLIAASPKSRVKLGPALVRLASATNIDINQIIRPYMEQLSRELGETSDLSVMQGKNAVFIDQISGTHRLRAVSGVGERFPLHATACGKALLSTLSPAKRDQYLGGGLERFTNNTITDPEELRQQIETASKTKVFFDLEEHTEGICAVGTTFGDPLGRNYAITLPVPTARFMRHKDEYEAALLKCREDILATMGKKL